MKRFLPFAIGLIGIVALAWLVPSFDVRQPRGMRITRAEAKRVADQQAAKLGIPVEKAWSNVTWVGSPHTEKELENDPQRRRAINNDPAFGPRLSVYKVSYYRQGLEKWQPYGTVLVSGDGEVVSAQRRRRTEEPGKRMTEAQLRPLADAFVASRKIPGAPSPVFEQARPNVQRNRTDWTFRYKVPSSFPSGKVVPYLYVYFTGDQFAGWHLIEEYADGSAYRNDATGLFGSLGLFGVLYGMLLLLLVIFLKKYHAGEVGIGTGSLLFAMTFVVVLAGNLIIVGAMSDGMGMGSLPARETSWLQLGFKIIIVDLPICVVLFLGWAVGESYARERWGERLASFDAILRRDPLNATVGRSLLVGLLLGPAVAAAAFAIGVIPLKTGLAHASMGRGAEFLYYLGGPLPILLASIADALIFPVVVVLFVLASARRLRVLWLGVLLAMALGAISGAVEVPIAPAWPQFFFGFGGILAAVAIFLAYDLLATSVAVFFGSMLVMVLPLYGGTGGELRTQLLLTTITPVALLFAYAIAALATRREVIYTYEDLAPHVKRIVERERVKAEIDAANRIQAALLPQDAPKLAGASVASHYRAATEIGGDYFDFLPQPSGEIGIAFGDVSGHGLTSGIVMAMAKAALLVQIDYDNAPRAVLDVLNEVVIKTAPKRIMMTFFFGILDPRSQTLRFSSAGHLDPYVFRAESRQLQALSSWGYPLGVRRREPFIEHTVEFSAGDRLILYSDGLIEAIDDDGEPFGFDRFEKTIVDNGHLTAEEIKKALLNSVRKFTHNRPPEDDQTLVVVSFDEVAADVLATSRAFKSDAAVGETVH